MNLIFLTLIYIFFASPSSDKPADLYTKGYFNFPLNPGTQTSLSGSFGDIRINHFHAGLDIRTGGREGKSVYSAAEGYVSRIGVSKGGYGNALYITHPNGLTTLYGHLKEYASKIKKRLLQEQYKRKTWEIDFKLEPGEIEIEKGELIAFSGNTGGSGGPHLHFEIRNKEERTLDPALFGFKEIRDNVAPTIEFISLKCLSTNARVNGQFGTFDFPVTRAKNGQYYIKQKITVWGKVGIEILTYDKTQNSRFKLGIKYLQIRKDNIPTYTFELGELSFHNKLDMNLHTNYERMLSQNKKLHKGYYESGNSLPFYQYDENKGILNFQEDKQHKITILVKDTYENQRSLTFSLQSIQESKNYIPNKLNANSLSKVSLHGSIIKIIRDKSNEKLFLVDGNRSLSLKSSYANQQEETFLFDLKDEFFSSYFSNDIQYEIPITDMISPSYNSITAENYSIDFKEVLYHPLFLSLKESNNRLLLSKDTKPLQSIFDVKWFPHRADIDIEKDKVYLVDGKRPKFVGGQWKGEQILFKPKEFGTYQIIRDQTKPSIELRSLQSKKIVFRIKDNLSGIKSFHCSINGKWLLMEYEYKNGLLWSERIDDKSLSGELILRVTDFANNIKTYKKTI